MADIDQKVLSDLADAIRGVSRMDMFPRTQDDKNFEALVKKMDDLEKGNQMNTKKMVESYDKALKDAGISKEIKSLRDVMEAQDQYKAMKSIANTLRDKDQLQFKNKDELERVMMSLQRQAESAGMTLQQMGIKTSEFYNRHINKWQINVKDHSKTIENLDNSARKLGNALDEAADETERFSSRVEFAKNMLGKIGNVAKTIAKDFIRLAEQEQRFAQANATADAGWIEGVTQMQISTLDYMKILKDTRRENLAMTAAGGDFKESLIRGTDSLRGFTASSTEAAQMSAAFHKNVARMGVAQSNLGDAVVEQTDLWKEHYRHLGINAVEFAKLTEELVNDQGMRSTLLTLQEKERKAYIMGVQQRQAEYITMGYTIDRAKELQKTFQALVGMSPKDRMKQAAKTRAMMGAMGMGAEGEELFNLQTRYRTMNEEERAKADIRMTEIQKTAAGKFGAMSGAGTSLGQSMSMQMMAEKTGFVQIAEKFETASGKGLEIDAKQLAELKKQATYQKEISEGSKKMLHGLDAWQSASNTAITSIGTNIVAELGGLISVNIAGFAATAGASLIGGGRFSGKGKGPKGGKGKGKGKGPKGKGGKGIGSIVAKSGMKSISKKIPLLAAGAGLMYGAERLMEGDFLGAGGEVLSGLLGATGIGAPLSMAIDAGLMARDIKQANDMNAPEIPTTATTTAKVDEGANIANQLLSTLQNIEAYLKETGALSDANSKSMTSVASAMKDATAVANMAYPRAGG